MTGIVQTGQFQQQLGLDTLGEVSAMRQRREHMNKQLKEQQKQGTLAAVGTGAAIGTQVMPGWGTLIGGAIGLIGSLAF